MATVPVKYIHSGMAGAPVLSGTAGALIAVLDACLINGFGLKTVDSLVVAGNVATMNISTGHSYEVGSVAIVAGATPSSLNGEWRITEVATNVAKFATTGIADQTATGTITTKVAPLGWSKLSGTNVAAYKSTDAASNGHYVRVDDTGTVEARAVGYEVMSDANTGTGIFPTSVQLTGGVYWHKSSTADSTARNWAVVGDGRIFYLWIIPADSTAVTSNGTLNIFGEPVSTGSADVFNTVLFGKQSARSSDFSAGGPFISYNNTSSYMYYTPRSYTGVGSSKQVRSFGEFSLISGNTFYSGSGPMLYPNAPDNALMFSRGVICEDSSVRGYWPGFFFLPQSVGFNIASKDQIAGQSDLAGRRLLALRFGQINGSGQNTTSGSYGCFVFDITGPWR